MSTPEPVWTSWRKSSYSGGGGGACVEVAFIADVVAVRDSKNTNGPTITVAPTAWRSFLSAARS
ncbi:MAG TPA: DUF397 domain-containing protein [Pseudonocardiaceae bacterium]|jgi:hypothetical protein|nr:DUF397 domain-containing protein [Pseudonocardiaceae bacterium]